MTATSSPAEPPESTLAAVIAEHEQAAVLYCPCEHPWSFHLSDGCTYDLDGVQQADGSWETPQCACERPDETLLAIGRLVAARVAELEAALAAAEARLRAVEALDEKWRRAMASAPGQTDDRESFGDGYANGLATAITDIRAALTPPQPAPEEPFGWTVKDGAEFVGPCGHVIRVTDDRMVLAALVAKAEQHVASCPQPAPEETS